MPVPVIIIIRTIAVGIMMILTIDLIQVGVDGRMNTMIDMGRGRDPPLPDGAEVVMMTTTATIIITMIALVIVATTMDTGTAEGVAVVAEVDGGDRVVGRGNGGGDIAMMTVDTRVARTRSRNRPSHPSHGQGRGTMVMRSKIDRNPKKECIVRMRITGGETEKQKIPKHLLVKWRAQWTPCRERAEGGARTKVGPEVTRIVTETKRIVQSIVNGIAAIAQKVEAGVVIVSLLVVKSVVVKVIDTTVVSMIGEGKKTVRMTITGHEEAMMKIVRREGMVPVVTDIEVPAEVLVVRELDQSQ